MAVDAVVAHAALLRKHGVSPEDAAQTQVILDRITAVPPDKVKRIKQVVAEIERAKSLGVRTDFDIPEYEDSQFDTRMATIVDQVHQAIEQHVVAFGTSLVQDVDMAKLLAKLDTAKLAADVATSEKYPALSVAKSLGSQATLRQKMKLLFGGNSVVEKGQATLAGIAAVKQEIVALVIEKFEAAGLNDDSTRALTPETTTVAMVEKIMGISL